MLLHIPHDGVCVCVCEREREKGLEFRVCERERKGIRVYSCVFSCVYMCVCVRVCVWCGVSAYLDDERGTAPLQRIPHVGSVAHLLARPVHAEVEDEEVGGIVAVSLFSIMRGLLLALECF